MDEYILTEDQRQALTNLLNNPSITTLWQAILAFEHYPFTTTSGLPFTYTFKLNRHGQPGNELQISRKSKTITRSSVEKALAAVVKMAAETDCGFPVQMSTPKELGTFWLGCQGQIDPSIFGQLRSAATIVSDLMEKSRK